MKRPPINSYANPNRSEPWADLELTDGSLQIRVKAFNGISAYQRELYRRRGEEFPEQTSNALKAKERNTPGPMQSLKLNIELPNEEHVLAVTEDGDLEFVASSKQRLTYYAHLAWYEPSTGEWTALNFVDVSKE